MLRMLWRRVRLSPSVTTAVVALAVFGAIAYAGVGESTPAVYKTALGTVPKAPNVDESSKAVATATCDPGQQVIGGGAQLEDVNMTSVVDGYPDLTSTAWTAHVANDDPKKSYGFIVTAICVASASAGTTGPTGPTAPAG